MLSYTENSLLICSSVAASLLLVSLLNRIWPITNRKVINEVTAWQLGVLGTTYGVILGFMLYTVWEGFRAAQIDANLEATSMLNVYRLADGLPSPQNNQIQVLAQRYERVVVDEEWPAMQRMSDDRAAGVVVEEMWRVLAKAEPTTTLATNTIDHIQYAMANLAERKNMRDLQRSSEVPRLLWLLLLIGGAATIVSSCLLGNDKKWLHYCQVAALTFVIVTALAAIADLARPYQGAVAVEPSAFTHALKLMNDRPVR
ncbi:MAG: DUF4239 domain-containing protein [Edaphobacter sp.]|uniref:bestrophin-like domain n=1 Tax=Edaphobacter sp. TaxID=1934404 RepID=UPI00238CD9E5|nr:DUF4239 domain-containing protein [Edaphobacter sp.]MDE1175285.1 DUF4239 domain-containing protein [Edaphobacter sp.]